MEVAKDDRAGIGPLLAICVQGASDSQWETKKDNLRMRNPAWNGFIQKMAVQAARDLGIKPDAGAVEAKLVKARLWAADACMPAHKV